MSFDSSICTISTCVDETRWCIDDDHCPEEVLLDHRRQAYHQTCEEDVCLLSVARCCCLFSADGAPAPREIESCSTVRSDWTGSRWTTLRSFIQIMQRDSRPVQLHNRDSLVTWLQSGSLLHPIPHGGEAGGRDWCSQ